MRQKAPTWKELVRDAVYPRGIKCIVCGAELAENTRYGVCPRCTLPYNENYCTVCGRAVPEQNAVCDQCKNETHAFTEARSCFVYKDAAATLVRRFKYRDARYLAVDLSEFAADVYYKTDWDIDVITFVPIHKSRRRTRGYNQAELLAAALGEKIGKPCVPLLRKTAKTKHMVGLSRKERQALIRDTFAPSEHIAFGADKTVLLVDDVFTTGSTVDECAEVLRKNGVRAVYVLTVASVPFKTPTV